MKGKKQIQKVQRHTSGLYLFVPRAFVKEQGLRAGDKVVVSMYKGTLSVKKLANAS